ENTLRTAANLQEAKRQELKATKYTPGPWTANWSTATNGGPERGWFVESESDRYAYGAIAELPDGREETKANARLIAAAPKMFEELERALDSPFEPDKWAQDVRWALEEADGIERHPQPAEKRRDDLRVQRAAPELLAALKKTVPLIQAAERKALMEEVLVAIAKAEGR